MTTAIVRRFKLLIALAGFAGLCAACGVAPVEEASEPAAQVESPLFVGSRTATGSYGCWSTGKTVLVSQPLAQTYSRPSSWVVSRYTVTLDADTSTAISAYDTDTMLCDDPLALWGDASCGTSYGGQPYWCNDRTWTACLIKRKVAGTSTWRWSRSGWIDVSRADYDPSSGAYGNYVITFHTTGQNGDGANGCPGTTGPDNYYLFH